MKLAYCGDLHITNRKPKNRIDNYFETVLGKVNQIYQIANEENCEVVIQPGDFFDSYKESHLVVQEIINILKKYPKICTFVVAGQHDMQFHNSDLSGTTLGTLLTHTDLITLLNKTPCCSNDHTAFYGASWNEEIPEIITPDCVNILVLHKMVVDKKLWVEQEGHTWANHLLLKTDFDLIVSGDNHKQFFAKQENRHLINIGSMMRSTIDQIDHCPAVAIYDTELKHYDVIDLEIKPFDEVMQLEKAEKEKEKNLQLESFIHSLKDKEVKEGQTIKLSFVERINQYCIENKVDQSIQDIIKDCLNES